MTRHTTFKIWACAGLMALASCGGGGGGTPPTEQPQADQTGVFTGFSGGNLDWESTGGAGDGPGAGADGDGGVGAGGDFGQFRGAVVTVWYADGTLLGSATTDDTKGMVTIKAGRKYAGALRIELRGSATATYFEEGRGQFVPFSADRVIRAWIPALTKNVGITPFTEAAYRMLTEGSTPERASGTPSAGQISAANGRVGTLLNQQFPAALHVDDITRLPFIKSPAVAAGSMRTDPRGRYGLVNGAFSKQASAFNADSPTPTLDATRQLAEDLLDGQLDGRNGSAPAAAANLRTYDPHTLTGELSSALAEQAHRFGSQEALDALPRVVHYGNTRYEGYLFDGSISKDGRALSTVAGWVGGNEKGLAIGLQSNRLPEQARTLQLYANNGHGGGFLKADANDGSRHKIYAIGDNVNGELGLGHSSPTLGQALEITLPGALTHAAGGFAHTVARMADGAVYAWGDNSQGQLGQGRSGTDLPRSLAPVRVVLPAAAVAVAATNMAAYALLEDGNVWAWGSNAGFGLLGNGQRDGVATTPARVASLSDIIQISARDSDVVVVKRDNSVWQWGSFPADLEAYTPGDAAAAYRGGNLSPTAVSGLPAGLAVRKVLTEQGLFVALLDNGHVYHWGVHFDLSANAVLRDLSARRVMGLPPQRDLMPGGFFGYGKRPFDRLTSMGVDDSGGMWKVRGRVAERFEPEQPTLQRRPQGQPRADCETCHTFIDQTIEELRKLQPAPGATACIPPGSVHAPGGVSLLHKETECLFCHNPSRAAYPGLPQSFAGTGSWPNCSPPPDLPPRVNTTPPVITTACVIPTGHAFTPPGTVCASCHNSVVARPLQSFDPPCAQPGTAELPSIATTTSVNAAFTPAGAAIASGATTLARRYELRGSLGAALAAGQSVAVLRNGAVLGNASVNGLQWNLLTTTDASDGLYSHAARVVAGSAFGPTSAAYGFSVDGTPPQASATVSTFTGTDVGTVNPGSVMSDVKPRVNGTISAAMAVGETLEVFRNGTLAGAAQVNGLAWSFAEPVALNLGHYSYQARGVDAVGNTSAFGNAASLTLVAGAPQTSITRVVHEEFNNATVPNGGSTADSSPRIEGSLNASLPLGYQVRVLRDGESLGVAAVSGTFWAYTDSAAPDGVHSYSARAEAGAVLGTAASYSITVDTVAPRQSADVTVLADDINGNLPPGATTSDTTPSVRGTLSSPLAGGEVVQLRRNNVAVAVLTASGQTWSHTETTALPNGSYAYSAFVVDAAGWVGPAGAALTLTVNASAVPLQNAATILASINDMTPVGNAIPLSNNRTPVLRGSIQRALNAGEVLKVYRNDVPQGNATVAAGSTSWLYSSAALSDGNHVFKARIEQAANTAVFGAVSSAVTVPIDATAPTQAVAVTQIADDAGSAVQGGNSTDSTPRVSGTLSAGLGAGESLRLRRTASASGASVTLVPVVQGSTWAYTESSALANGSYSYAAQVQDAAGNVGTASNSLGVTIISTLPSVTGIGVQYSAGLPSPRQDGTSVPQDGLIADTTPTVLLALPGSLSGGAVLRVYQGGVAVGTATFAATTGNGTVWVFTDGAGAGQGQRRYTARVENGTAFGTFSSEHRVVVDTIAPSNTAQIVRGVSAVMPNTSAPVGVSWTVPPLNATIAAGATTNDQNPTLDVQLQTSLGSGDTLRVTRNGALVATLNNTAPSCGAACYRVTVASGFSIPAPLASPNLANPIGSAVYTAQVLDAALNAATLSANFTIDFNYFSCDFARADAAANAAYLGASHPAWNGLRCASCHTATVSTSGVATPSGALIAVPATSPTYWCRRP